MKKVPKVVVIGLDAATWTVIRPLVAEGKMPNLAKLMKAGVSGTLESILPPITPPEPLNGFQISGMDTPSVTSPFIHPPELREELVKHVGGIQLDLRFLGAMSTDERRNQVTAEMKQIDKQWTKAALYLLENHPQDVMMFVFMSIDTVQHHFWHHMDKEHFLHDPKRAPKFGDAVRKVYERLDAAAGQIIDRLPPETA